jgi:hypothetical protein
MTGGEFVAAFAFLHKVTGAREWIDRAVRAANVHWAVRDKSTNLIPNQAEWEDRFDAYTTDTSITGLWCGRLLTAASLSGNEELLTLAVSELRAFLRHQWHGTLRPWGQLNLDGTPMAGPRVPVPPGLSPGEVPYACWAPRGELDLWPAYMLGYEFPQETALAYVQAYRMTGDGDMLEGANRWAGLYADEEQLLRARGGTYAQHYGMLISFYCELAAATGKKSHLRIAEAYARQAVGLLFNGKIFRGHPAKPYYEAADGVGFLCHGLVQLQDALDGVAFPTDPLQRNA